MEFRDYAATHTTELVTRLLADASSHSRQHLTRLRAALDDAVVTIEGAIEAQSSATPEPEIEELVEQLTRAATTHAEAEAARALDPLRAEITAHVDEIAVLAGSLEEAQSQVDLLRGDVETARAAVEGARSQLEAATAELESVRAQLEETLADRARFEEAASIATSQAEAAEAKLEAVTSLFQTSNSRVKALERVQDEHDRAVRALKAKLQAQPAASVSDTGSLSLLDELLGSFEALSAATTIADVLTTLAEQLAADFCRVAVFRVKGNRLEGEHQIGIDLPADVGKVMMPLGMDSLLTRAATSGESMRLSGSELGDQSRAPFAGTPSCALALPIVVNDETLAVVYADDSGQTDSGRAPVELERSARIADALRQHAVALLTRLTGELKMLAELRAYADLLLKEMEQMYNADVEAEQTGETLTTLLKSNLEYARSIYSSRVTHEGADAASLLEDQITMVIETQSKTPFGRDLAIALGRAPAEPASESRASAEA
jgi:hypothetical protein